MCGYADEKMKMIWAIGRLQIDCLNNIFAHGKLNIIKLTLLSSFYNKPTGAFAHRTNMENITYLHIRTSAHPHINNLRICTAAYLHINNMHIRTFGHLHIKTVTLSTTN
jgi:hypothetical protein